MMLSAMKSFRNLFLCCLFLHQADTDLHVLIVEKGELHVRTALCSPFLTLLLNAECFQYVVIAQIPFLGSASLWRASQSFTLTLVLCSQDSSSSYLEELWNQLVTIADA